MRSAVWTFVCDGESAPIWDASLQTLHRCWRTILYCFFCTVLLICTAFNIGVVINLRTSQSVHVNNGRRNSWQWILFMAARSLLNTSIAVIFAVNAIVTWMQSARVLTFSAYALLVICFAAGAMVDLICIGRPQFAVLTTAAVVTQVLAWLPIYVLNVFDFRLVISEKSTSAPWLRVCCICLCGFETLLLMSHFMLLWMKARCLRQVANYVRMHDGVPNGLELSDRLGKAEDGLGRGLLSFMLFLWVNPLIELGSTKPLESYEQLFELPEDLKSMRNLEKLEKQLEKKSDRVSRIYLLKAIWKVFGWRYLALGVFELLLSLINYIPPLMLSGVVSYLEVLNGNDEDEKRQQDVYSGAYYAAGIIVTSFVAGLLSVQCNYQISKLKLSIRAAVMQIVYRKLLRVRACDLSAEMESSQVMNLIGTDCERLATRIIEAHYFWTTPIFMAVTLYLMYVQVGFAFVGGVTLAVLLIPVNYVLTQWIIRLFDAQMADQDRRVKLLSECLAAIRVIKLHAWEPYFQRRLQSIRDSEMRHWTWIKYVDVFCGFFWESSPMVAIVLTFTLYIWMGNTLTAAKTFTTISIFHLGIEPLVLLPWVLESVGGMWTSTKRLQKYLAIHVADYTDYYDVDVTNTGLADAPLSRPCLMKMTNVSFSWQVSTDKNVENDAKNDVVAVDNSHTADVLINRPIETPLTPTLKNLNFELFEGELLGIVGRVGSGKTSLLMAIIAEMHRVFEPESPQCSSELLLRPNVLHDGFSVALQDVWIQQGTLKENILCCTSAGVSKLREKRLNTAAVGNNNSPQLSEQNEQRYNDIIDACALRHDVLGALPHGDATEIGEHGVTLSGGQRARVALARACYADKAIVLLDDPLSAVDANVAQHIFTNCVRGLLRNKTVVLVTHHVELLRHAADRVVVMEGGRIVKCGPPAEVLAKYENTPFTETEEDETHVDQSLKAVVPEAVEIDQLQGDEVAIANYESTAIEIAGNPSALINDEEREYGVVSLGVWKELCRCVGWLSVVVVLTSYVLREASFVSTDLWLAHWTQVSERNDTTTTTTDAHARVIDNWYYLRVYIAIAGVSSIANMHTAVSFAYAELKLARRLHNVLLNTLMYATQQFYDTTPSGRIINRYGSDINVVDADLPPNIDHCVNGIFRLLGAFTIICIGLPWFTLVIGPVMPWYIWIQHLYRKTSRELQRIFTLTRSPMYSWFTETIKGLPHIRAMRLSSRFDAEFCAMLHANQRVKFTEAAASQWLALRLQMVGAVLVSVVVVLALALRADAAMTGLALSYALTVVSVLNKLVESFVDTEQQVVSVERIMQYSTGIARENDDENSKTRTTSTVSTEWPERGEIKFENVWLRYRNDLPDLYALSGVTLSVRPNENLAVVGRTGAGKSSMLQALFRTHELAQGRILIDDVDIAQMNRRDLRSRLAIIPQNPMLFDASLRHNIDPLERHSDDEIIHAIKSCFLEDVVQKLGGWTAALQTTAAADGDESALATVGEAGARLSMGERQLVCLARALVSKSKILCLDEATASVDFETDDLIQQVLRNAFKHSTVICIAHRIQTIRDYDRVAVMENGAVVECDSPQMLMKNSGSLFYKLATAHIRQRRNCAKNGDIL